MRFILELNLIFLLNFCLSSQANAAPTSFYANSKVLVEPDVFVFYWNYTKVDIVGEVHAKTSTGWISFGLSPNGGMDGADVFVFFRQNGVANFTDRHIQKRNVLIDTKQDWSMLSHSITNGYTIVKFRRELDTCDDKEDIVIESGTPRIIFAWNTKEPLNGAIEYHGASNRGSSSAQLITALNQQSTIRSDDNIVTYEFRVNVTIPSDIDTLYHCHMFKVPTEVMKQKHHVLRIDTLITPGHELKFHHMDVYSCEDSYESEYLAANPSPLPGNCYDEKGTHTPNKANTWRQVQGHCRTMSLTWSIGGTLHQEFPEGLGFPMGGHDAEFTYFHLKVHYNNPELTPNLQDFGGIKFHMTTNLRKTEIGVYSLVSSSKWSALFIPPFVENLNFDFSCRSDCLNNWYDGSEITVFGSMPHTHLTGSQVYTKIIRNGEEIGFLEKTKNFDFNYQTLNFLKEPVVLKMGDELRTSCVYSSMDRTGYTFGGPSAMEEMCGDFLYYYPRRVKTGACILVYSQQNWIDFFLKLNSTGLIKLNNTLTYDSITEDLKTLKVDEVVTKSLKMFIREANLTQTCISSGKSTTKDHPQLKAKEFVETRTCKAEVTGTTSTTTTTSTTAKVTNMASKFGQSWKICFGGAILFANFFMLK